MVTSSAAHDRGYKVTAIGACFDVKTMTKMDRARAMSLDCWINNRGFSNLRLNLNGGDSGGSPWLGDAAEVAGGHVVVAAAS